MSLFLASMLALATQIAGDPAIADEETSIPFAANGGITNWVMSKTDDRVLYVQSRRQQWYRVKMSGPCLSDSSWHTMVFITSSGSDFDKFTTITSLDEPYKRCGVDSIRKVITPAAFKASHTNVN